jgi:hypothetical protein
MMMDHTRREVSNIARRVKTRHVELYNRASFEWDRLASRTATDWDAWLRSRLRPLRW